MPQPATKDAEEGPPKKLPRGALRRLAPGLKAASLFDGGVKAALSVGQALPFSPGSQDGARAGPGAAGRPQCRRGAWCFGGRSPPCAARSRGLNCGRPPPPWDGLGEVRPPRTGEGWPLASSRSFPHFPWEDGAARLAREQLVPWEPRWRGRAPAAGGFPAPAPRPLLPAGRGAARAQDLQVLGLPQELSGGNAVGSKAPVSVEQRRDRGSERGKRPSPRRALRSQTAKPARAMLRAEPATHQQRWREDSTKLFHVIPPPALQPCGTL